MAAKRRLLVTSDLHFTDKPQDSYRFGIFPYLESLCKELQDGTPTSLLILGDLTDHKDKHSAQLVNRIMDGFDGLRDCFSDIFILMGNHDEYSEETPYFRFLDGDSILANVWYIWQPSVVSMLFEEDTLLHPYRRDPREFLKDYKDLSGIRYIFMHQTMYGSKASNGQEMEGLSPRTFSKKNFNGTVISGDIHVPQDVAGVTYVGSPYHVHFGDSFEPRVLQIDLDPKGDRIISHPTSFLSRHRLVIERAEEIKSMVSEGDQVKVRLILSKAEFVEWDKKRREVMEVCKEVGVTLFGVEVLQGEDASEDCSGEECERPVKKEAIHETSPFTVLDHFISKEKIDPYVAKAGENIARRIIGDF